MPRPFRLLEELKNSSKFEGVNYGLRDQSDKSFTHWDGSIISQYGDVVSFTFVCDENYPKTAPKIKFDSAYLNYTKKDDGNMKHILKRLLPLCTFNTTEFSPECSVVLAWTPKQTIGEFLSNIRNTLCTGL